MLPPGHSSAGIMRPTINRRSRRIESFTDVEAARVRETIAGAEASCAMG
jgi:hypothetical protein